MLMMPFTNAWRDEKSNIREDDVTLTVYSVPLLGKIANN